MNRIGAGMMSNLTEVVKNLIIINVLVYIAVNVIQIGAAYVPFEFGGLVDFLGIHYFDSPNFKPFQLVSNMFVHGSPMHILFNMMSLYFLGPMIENRLGSMKFFNFYIIAGFGAVLLDWVAKAARIYWMSGSMFVGSDTLEVFNLYNTGKLGRLPVELEQLYQVYFTPTVGASGAIFGIFIAFALFFPTLKLMIIPIPFPIQAKYLVMVVVVGSIILGIGNWDNIAHFGHLGGGLFGFLTIMFWRMNGKV